MNNKKYLFLLGLLSITYPPTAKADLLQCTPCPAGTYGKGGKCIDCEAGTYSDTIGSTSCKQCAEGKTSDKRATSCKDLTCPSGRYKSGNFCLACPDGHYCINNVKTQCAPFTYRKGSLLGGSSCENCEEGYFATSDRTACSNNWKLEYNITNNYKSSGSTAQGQTKIVMQGGQGGYAPLMSSGYMCPGVTGEVKTFYTNLTLPLAFYYTVGTGGNGISTTSGLCRGSATHGATGNDSILRLGSKEETPLTANGGTGGFYAYCSDSVKQNLEQFQCSKDCMCAKNGDYGYIKIYKEQ